MGILSKIDRHVGLVNRMADTVGADVGGALASGRLHGHEFRGAVLRCTGCDHVSECVEWLGAHAADGAAAAPDYCRNAGLMARLKH